jgi:23S rRNA (guanosine2251-2'-O)-methyltransferase
VARRRGGDAVPLRVTPGIHPVRELLRAGGDVREVVIASSRDETDEIREIRDLARAAGVVVREVARGEVDRIAEGVVHQGVVSISDPYPYAELNDLAVRSGDDPALLVALDGVTDPHNLGSIARTSEAVGADGLIVPARRAAGVTPSAEKAAAGALAHLPVAQVPNLTRALHDLGERGIWSVGLDADGETRLHDCELLGEPVVIVVGAEGRGLSRLVAESCDMRIRLPMRGLVASLNASVAAAVVLYEARRRRDGL